MFCPDGVVRGYLHRSIPNAVSTDLQGEEIDRNDPIAVITGILNQCGKLKTRGSSKIFVQEF